MPGTAFLPTKRSPHIAPNNSPPPPSRPLSLNARARFRLPGGLCGTPTSVLHSKNDNKQEGPHRKWVIGFSLVSCNDFHMKNAMPCVGLVVLAGCLTFIVAPDDKPSIESQVDAAFNPLP